MIDQRGQITVEFILSATLLGLVTGGSGALLRSQWLRAKCAYLTFESTRTELQGSGRKLWSDISVQTYDNGESILGEGHCGHATSRVSLPKLQREAWAL